MSVIGDVGPTKTNLWESFELHVVCISCGLQHFPWGVVYGAIVYKFQDLF